jgi:oligoendopeptidase F
MQLLSRRSVLLSASASAALFMQPGLARGEKTSPADTAAWDLSDLFATPEAWTAERDALLKALPELAEYRGKLGESPASLRSALTKLAALNQRLDRLVLYANLVADADTRVAVAQERRQLAGEFRAALGAAAAWVNPEIIALGGERVAGFEAADPGLAPFRYPLASILRLAPHTLGDEAEHVLAAASDVLDTPARIRSQLVDADIAWLSLTLSTGTALIDEQGYVAHRSSQDRADRKAVFDAFFNKYAQFKTSLGVALTGELQSHNFQAASRHYGSALEAALSEHNVPVGVYKTLIEETHVGLPVLHRYFDVRRRLLSLPDLHYYDLYAPATQLGDGFTLEQMRSLTLEAMRPLGRPYSDTLTAATAARWIDPLPRAGKRGGGYQASAYGVHPYLLLNLSDDYDSLTTFAHEWGHAMHTVLADQAQPYPTARYPIFIAEIASTNNEQLLNHLMVTNAKTKAEKLFYLDQLLELFRGTFFRQAMFAEFELRIHELAQAGEGLSGEKFSEIYFDVLRTYHGPNVVIDRSYAIEWAYAGLLYGNFYVYQYATSIAASANFSDRTLGGGTTEREAYLDVLREGGSDDPVAILRRGGLDMTSPVPYRALIAKFGRTLDAVEALMVGP